MEQFKGFPAKTQFTAVPNAFFSTLLPQISDIAELKTTLHVFQALYQKRGYPRFTSYQELLANKSLMSSLQGEARPPDEVLRNALKMATGRGTILHLVMDRDGAPEDIYLLNDEPGKRTMAKIQSGELKLSGLEPKEPALVDAEERPNIFTLYEQNIGMLTPMIREEFVDALKVYPESWIRDAIKEAVNQNIRKKSYILAILERWTDEGRGDGTYRGDSKKTDPDKYIKGKYGHMVGR
jgi:DnaD/phage-associated family protein